MAPFHSHEEQFLVIFRISLVLVLVLVQPNKAGAMGVYLNKPASESANPPR